MRLVMEVMGDSRDSNEIGEMTSDTCTCRVQRVGTYFSNNDNNNSRHCDSVDVFRGGEKVLRNLDMSSSRYISLGVSPRHGLTVPHQRPRPRTVSSNDLLSHFCSHIIQP